jgi:hypothetical protein
MSIETAKGKPSTIKKMSFSREKQQIIGFKYKDLKASYI